MRTLLLLFLLMNFFIVSAQKKTDWNINYVAIKDTVKVGEMYTAYITVKNKSVKESDIRLEGNGRALNKDEQGRFVIKKIGKASSSETYSKVDQVFNIKCTGQNGNVHSFVRSYYVSLDMSDGEPEQGDMVLNYVLQMPEFIATEKYPTFDDYLESKIKAKQVIALGKVFVEVIIDKGGSVIFLEKIRGEIDKENLDKLITIIEDSPKWKPGVEGNSPVKIKRIIAIKFN